MATSKRTVGFAFIFGLILGIAVLVLTTQNRNSSYEDAVLEKESGIRVVAQEKKIIFPPMDIQVNSSDDVSGTESATVTGTPVLDPSVPPAMSFAVNEAYIPEYNIFDYCAGFLEKNKKCPNDVCVINCEGGRIYKDCPVTCEPRPCYEFDAGNCPQATCQVLKGCDGEQDVCYPLFETSPPKCGNLAYAGQDVECCSGLVKRCGMQFIDRTCEMNSQHSIYSVPICLPCGNGICNQFENECNCPEDCK